MHPIVFVSLTKKLQTNNTQSQLNEKLQTNHTQSALSSTMFTYCVYFSFSEIKRHLVMKLLISKCHDTISATLVRFAGQDLTFTDFTCSFEQSNVRLPTAFSYISQNLNRLLNSTLTYTMTSSLQYRCHFLMLSLY